jgi:hypothetical protein
VQEAACHQSIYRFRETQAADMTDDEAGGLRPAGSHRLQPMGFGLPKSAIALLLSDVGNRVGMSYKTFIQSIEL